MQKHDVWVSNQGYLTHLKTLTKIRERVATPKSHRYHLSKPPESSRNYTNSASRVTCLEGRRWHTRSREEGRWQTRSREEGLTMRDMQVVWDNYLIGKRII